MLLRQVRSRAFLRGTSSFFSIRYVLVFLHEVRSRASPRGTFSCFSTRYVLVLLHEVRSRVSPRGTFAKNSISSEVSPYLADQMKTE